LPKDIPLKADKGYQSKKNAKKILKQRNLKNHILKKAVRNKPLTKWEILHFLINLILILVIYHKLNWNVIL